MNLKNYLKQHDDIRNEIKTLKELIKNGGLDEHSGKIALHVSSLSGKIKIHLLSEDKYLYPTLLNMGNEDLRMMAGTYQNEMGSLADNFAKFKDMYNTQNKIMQNKFSFESDMNNIIGQIEKRLVKEEGELYKMIK